MDVKGFTDSFRFLSMGWDDLVKTLGNDDFDILKKTVSKYLRVSK